MPYRIDIPAGGVAGFERLVALGALDVDVAPDGSLAALMPDRVHPDDVAAALALSELAITPAVARDDGSVWILSPKAFSVGRLRIVPAGAGAGPDALQLVDGSAFGTGLHPTTALCLEAIDENIRSMAPAALLDVGTGSGILALAALRLGVPRATGIDVEGDALQVAAENVRINGLGDRVELILGGPESITGTWPFMVANVLAAPLIEMAPALVRRLGQQGQLLLSGFPASLEQEVVHAYTRLGLRQLGSTTRSEWTAVLLQAPW